MEKQTAGRDILGNLAPEFARLNDDVLFGEVWAKAWSAFGLIKEVYGDEIIENELGMEQKKIIGLVI